MPTQEKTSSHSTDHGYLIYNGKTQSNKKIVARYDFYKYLNSRQLVLWLLYTIIFMHPINFVMIIEYCPTDSYAHKICKHMFSKTLTMSLWLQFFCSDHVGQYLIQLFWSKAITQLTCQSLFKWKNHVGRFYNVKLKFIQQLQQLIPIVINHIRHFYLYFRDQDTWCQKRHQNSPGLLVLKVRFSASILDMHT